ncbi:MAG: hypothetical protein NC302_10740 [Bacteroidales bacterium]|nr:hypothetical protein [Bacteroidales bacterium]MCM1415082.1 hypothetical protein [bacterium]MCM1424389.1 hypothetical protein [bacterium]
MKMTAFKEQAAELMEQDMEINKFQFLLIGTVCFLGGICIGLLIAPLTHGVSLFSHNVASENGSRNGNQNCNRLGNNEE